MTKVFQTLTKKSKLIFQQVEVKDLEALKKSCFEYKEIFSSHVDAVKKLIVIWVESKQRAKAKALHAEVKDARMAAERLIRSSYLSSEAGLAESRESLILVAKRMIKIEKALCFADDMLFSGQISSNLSDAVHYAQTATRESKTLVEAMRQIAKTRELEDDSSLKQTNRAS
jgi:hypothetical protein